MKVVQINATCGSGSTGKICESISRLLNEKNIENYVFYSTGKSNYEQSFKFCQFHYQKIQALKGRVLGNNGFNSKKSTRTLLKKIDEIKPDIIHLHNIHTNDINLEMLFDYIREKHIKTFYTFHDCWAFTGYCYYFTVAKCDKYKTKCENCPNRKKISWFFDRSTVMQKRKTDIFTGVDVTIITPSQWLADLVWESLLGKYPVKVINNGINLETFRFIDSDFRVKHNCVGKYIVLGVAFNWERRKGLDAFLELYRLLPDNYQIVLVGTDDKTDKLLPENVISIHRTKTQKELAEIYSAADVFFNPTVEDNYPTVNMEANACGTPVVTFKTGGSPEIVDKGVGIVLEENTAGCALDAIIACCNSKEYSSEKCIKLSKEFDEQKNFSEYVNLYCET